MPTPALEVTKEVLRHLQEDADEPVWLCANCGEAHRTNAEPCTNCGAETFALLETAIEPADDGMPERVESDYDVEYHCTECGRVHTRNNPPCNDCGAMDLETVRVPNRDGTVSDDDPATEGGQITAVTVAAWMVGLVTLGHAVVSLLLLTWAVPFFAIATVASWPPARRWYESGTGYELTTGAALLVYCVFMLVGYVALFV